ncbi:MAG: hypothetical protein ABEH77_04845 [Halobacteriaceae archaeon]
MVDREVLVESATAAAGALVFIAFVVGVGTAFGGSSLSETGATWMVAGIALFVVVMSALGWLLSTRF